MHSWRPSASTEALCKRARLVARMRSFLDRRGLTEVSTPLVTAGGVTDPHIESTALDRSDGYLRTSPEYWHKRLLAAGFGDLYELGPVFRDGERGRLHQPEFTLLEWYRVGWDWQELAAEVVALIEHCLDRPEAGPPAFWRSWRDCFLDQLGVDALTAEREQLENIAGETPPGLTRDMLLDYLFATRIQPEFPADRITIVHDYPASQAALARLKPADPAVAERFEVFVGPVELANGYRELLDPEQQRNRFERDNRIRRELKRTVMPIDEDLIAALEAGMPDCSGVALGVDRLVMLATNAQHITEVMSFPSPHPGSP
ncbi:EF-P lysine aminoacylase GenX [Wenzhouxiangella sp. AB-CW3]|uniref:EF-P lysine aminoacylase EpmA n=1 Tax=Wenzhouxiangella sp. AB-CW3 TaxID=2771012 RepID=UPI00168AB879|nr:EF-P lysine aminoacylase EpmA [Wenzhouxiangella sp. AB-CW3]QOC23583.1 EF-P lysine aminoacylase GenX [Wenzhouxiangella sp. AB-CW3]